ncbi:hypothetical protein [Streptomyces sp. NPDC000851]
MAETLAGLTESERAEMLRTLGAKGCEETSRAVRRTPLPAPRLAESIVSSVEWV